MGALRPFFCLRMRCVRKFLCWEKTMNKRAKNLVYGALIGAMYAALTHLQNILLPGSATWAIQLRVSEALCVLGLFTPAAVPGLTVGCLVFNLTYAGALPLDPLIGSAATALAVGSMYLLRKMTVKGLPLPALLMPALWNALLVGWELTVYVGGAFWINALYVAAGELIVMLTLGTVLYTVMKKHRLDHRLFG